jgi:hypothetical protein
VALPLIPFAAGLALGSLVTYGYKDKAVHKRVVRGAEDLYAWAKGGVIAAMDWIPGLTRTKEDAPELVEVAKTEAAEQLERVADATVEAAEQVKETVAKPAARRAKEAASELKHA